MIIQSAFRDLFGIDALPALDAVIYEAEDKWPELHPRVFNVKSSTKEIEQTTQVSGVGQFATVNEGSDVGFDSPAQGFDKTYTHVQYGLGIKTTHIAMMNNRWGIIQKMARELGRSAVDTRETVAAAVFNNGFDSNFLGPDGVELFSLLHPLFKSGGNFQNELTVSADLDVPSLELGLTDFRAFVSPSGKKKRIVPTGLMVASANEWNASEIVGGKNRSDTSNNTINAFRNRAGLPSFSNYFVWDYLNDPDAWMILANPSDTELRFYNREKFHTLHSVDFESRTIKTAGWMQFSVGWSDPYGVYGSPGQ